MEIKVCDRCGDQIKQSDVMNRICLTKSTMFGYFPVTPIKNIDLCQRCLNDVLKFIAKAPKEDNNDSKAEM